MIQPATNLAAKLRLNGIYHALEKRCNEAVKHNLHPAEFIKILLEDEALARRNATASRLTKKAKFRTQCDLENWDKAKPRGLSTAKFKELACGSFYERKENLIIVGATGLGKTHLAIAIGRALCQKQISVSFYSTNLLFEKLHSDKLCGKYLPSITALSKIGVIILDDFALRNYTHEEAGMLLELLEERYSKNITIITSQVEPSGWRALFEDSVISEAIIDRLVNPSDRIALTGESYRKERKQIDPKT
jgi:DNA replication protein DnaC